MGNHFIVIHGIVEISASRFHRRGESFTRNFRLFRYRVIATVLGRVFCL